METLSHFVMECPTLRELWWIMAETLRWPVLCDQHWVTAMSGRVPSDGQWQGLERGRGAERGGEGARMVQWATVRFVNLLMIFHLGYL